MSTGIHTTTLCICNNLYTPDLHDAPTMGLLKWRNYTLWHITYHARTFSNHMLPSTGAFHCPPKGGICHILIHQLTAPFPIAFEPSLDQDSKVLQPSPFSQVLFPLLCKHCLNLINLHRKIMLHIGNPCNLQSKIMLQIGNP